MLSPLFSKSIFLFLGDETFGTNDERIGVGIGSEGGKPSQIDP
jgi:hypothetical protein